MIFDLRYYQEPSEARLYLAKPNRTIIGELNEKFQLKREVNLGSVSRIEFSLPYQISKLNKLIDNPNISNIKDRYCIKFVEGVTEQWYVIKNPVDNMTDSTDFKSCEAYSLEIELADKRIRGYSVISKNASGVLQDALSETIWSIGSIDASFDLLFRSFDVTDNSVLDFIYEIAKTFNALVTFDTVNRVVNFLKFDNYGVDEGLEVSYGVLLKNAKKVENTDEFYTRLIGVGKDGLGIQGQSPTGQSYIDDFSHFLYPFSRDASNNVLTHSDFMSDSLCNAILDYIELITSSVGTYQGYLTNLTSYQTTLTTQQNALATLQNDLAIIEDQISVANANGQSTTTLVSQKVAKAAEIATKQSEIATTQGNITTVNTNIANLQNTLSMDANFIPEQLIELNPYIIVGVYENTNISDAKQLYDLMVEEFEKVKTPKIVVEIGIVNFMKCITEQSRWNKLQLGNIIKITNTKVGIDVKAKIMGFSVDYESDDVTITISNVKELLTDEARVLRDLYRSNITSGTVSNNQYKWNSAASDVNEVQSVLDSVWSAAARAITASNNESVTIDRKGIITRDLTDPNKYVVIQHGQIALTDNNGNTWDTVMNADGVYAQRLIGQILAGVNLTITNSAGTVSIDANGMNVSAMDLTVSRADNKSRVKINGTDGIKIQSSADGVTWTDKLSAGIDGKLIASDLTVSNINVTSGIMNIGSKFSVAVDGTFTATGATISGDINMSGGSISWSSVNSDPVATSASSTANSALTTAQQIANGTYSGGTFISGSQIFSPTITGGVLQTATTGRRLVLSGSELQSLNSSTKDGFTLDGSTGFLKWYSGGIQTGGIFKDTSQGYEQLLLSHDNLLLSGTNDITVSSDSIHIGNASVGSTTYFAGNVNFSGTHVNFSTATVDGLPPVTAKFG